MALDPALAQRVQQYFSSGGSTGGSQHTAATRPTSQHRPTYTGIGSLPTGGPVGSFVNENSSEAPQNVGQWLLNLLGAGTYVGANIANEMGRADQKARDGVTPVGQVMWESLTAPLTGIARGAGEAIGLRFDRDNDGINERPRTWGQNLEDIGVFDNVDEKNPVQTFARGAVGTIADIGLDPTTYLSLGVAPLIKGAVKGAAAVVKGAEGAERGLVSGIVKGAGREWVDARTVAQNAKAARRENVQLRQDFKANGVKLTRGDASQVRTVLQQAGVSRTDMTPEIVDSVLTGLKRRPGPVDDIVAATAASADDVARALPDRSAADALTPTLQGTRRTMVKPDEVRAMFNASVKPATGAAKAAPRLPAGAEGIARLAADEAGTVKQALESVKQLQAMPGGREFLSHKVTLDGKPLTVSQVIEAAATRRLTGAPSNTARAELERILTEAASGTKLGTKKVFDPKLLATQVAAKTGYTLTKSDLADFLATPAGDKLDRLRTIISGPKSVGYSDFTEALAAASRGELKLTDMRKMAAAVGIAIPKGAKTQTARDLLKTEGEFNWAQIQRTIKDDEGVFEAQGLTPAALDEAAAVDVPTVRQNLQVTFAEKIGPGGLTKTGSRRGAATYAGIQSLGNALRGRLDEGVESFDLTDSSLQYNLWSAITKAVQPGVTGKIGIDRRIIIEDVMQPLRLVEDWASSMGATPRITGADAGTTFHVKMSEILDNLPADTVGRALFDPLIYRKVPSKTGLTLYPTTIAKAAAEAMRLTEAGVDDVGAIAEAVARVIVTDSKRFRNDYIVTGGKLTEPGGDIVADVAAAMAEPMYVNRLLAAHLTRKPIAEALSMDVAGRVVNPLGDAAIKVLAEVAGGGDRKQVWDLLEGAWNKVAEMKGGKDGTHLVDEIARERINNGFLSGILGEAGARVYKADGRASKANLPPGSTRSAKQAAEAAAAAQAKLQSSGPSRGAEGGAQAARRGQQAAAEAKNLDDAAETISATIDDMVARGEIEDTPRARIEAMWEVENAYKGAVIFHKIGVLGEGSFGQADVKGLIVAVNGNTFRQSGLYAEDMLGWVKRNGLDQQPAKVRQIFTALQRVGDGDIREVLLRGMPADPLNPLARTAIEPLDEDAVKLAEEMQQFIDVIFAPGNNGLFSRSGVVASDLASELKRINFKDGPEVWAKFDLDNQISLADQTGIWRTWDLDSTDDPLDALVRYHTAIQASSVKPAVGASFGRHFSAAAQDMSVKDAIARGWQKLDTTAEDADLARFIDPNLYFDPKLIKQLTYTQEFLNASRRFEGKLGQITDIYDSILGVLKSSNTLWRPGHHVTNILGETFMNIMAGVNPMRYGKGLGVMQAGGKLTDADLSPLAKYNAQNTPAGFEVKESFSGDAVQIVTTVGGKKTVQSIDPATIWQAALDHSVAMTHGLAEDILTPMSTRIRPGLGSQVTAPIRGINSKLAELSAARDNIFRITHFVDALEKGQFSSLDNAFREAAKIVHDYHPTMQTLSAFEQKYARRLVFFYTWQRQAIARVLKTAVDRPGLVTAPSKMLYNMAEANGLEPDSIGAPQPDDPRIASYGKETLLGPQFTAGDTPFDEGMNLWGVSLSAPQIDGLQSLFKGLTFKPEDGLGNVGNILAGAGESLATQLNPLLQAPGELAAGNNYGGGPINDIGTYLFDSAGLPTQLDRGLGGGFRAALGDDKASKQTDQQNEADQVRSLLNLFTGMKFTNYTSAASQKRAQLEQSELLKKLSESIGN